MARAPKVVVLVSKYLQTQTSPNDAPAPMFFFPVWVWRVFMQEYFILSQGQHSTQYPHTIIYYAVQYQAWLRADIRKFKDARTLYLQEKIPA